MAFWLIVEEKEGVSLWALGDVIVREMSMGKRKEENEKRSRKEEK